MEKTKLQQLQEALAGKLNIREGQAVAELVGAIVDARIDELRAEPEAPKADAPVTK